MQSRFAAQSLHPSRIIRRWHRGAAPQVGVLAGVDDKNGRGRELFVLTRLVHELPDVVEDGGTEARRCREPRARRAAPVPRWLRPTFHVALAADLHVALHAYRLGRTFSTRPPRLPSPGRSSS